MSRATNNTRCAAPAPAGKDEISVLTGAFNEMLGQIQERDTALQAAFEALRQSEERYRLVSEISSDYVYSLRVDNGGTLTCEWITDRFTQITGYTSAEINLRGWRSLYHSGDVPVAEQHYETLLSGQPDSMEARIVTKGQRVR